MLLLSFTHTCHYTVQGWHFLGSQRCQSQDSSNYYRFLKENLPVVLQPWLEKH